MQKSLSLLKVEAENACLFRGHAMVWDKPFFHRFPFFFGNIEKNH